ncbi:MAG: hypothetical protein ACREJX_11615 [Polyangiaceae bacterium]
MFVIDDVRREMQEAMGIKRASKIDRLAACADKRKRQAHVRTAAV